VLGPPPHAGCIDEQPGGARNQFDPQTKLIASWFVGSRDALSAEWFMGDLWDRLAK
jgi:hypothetical protein